MTRFLFLLRFFKNNFVFYYKIFKQLRFRFPIDDFKRTSISNRKFCNNFVFHKILKITSFSLEAFKNNFVFSV